MSRGVRGSADFWRSENEGFESIYVESGDFGQLYTIPALCWLNHLGREGCLSGERTSEVRQAAVGTFNEVGIDGALASLSGAILWKIETIRAVNNIVRLSVNNLWH